MRRVRTTLAAAAAIAAATTLSGCGIIAATAGSYAVTPQGVEVRDARVRDLLPFARGDSARGIPKDAMPRDALLRELYAGTYAYYAGRWTDAAAALDRAQAMAEDRFTKSAARTVASMLTNDRALDYVPGDTERLFVHYVAGMALSAAGNRDGAAVEARRLGAMLERLQEKADDRDRTARALLRYASGALFEAAGEANDADVAYRNAAALLGDSARVPGRATPPADSGDVILFVEYGFAAHRVPQDLLIPVYEPEYKAFGSGGKAAEQLAVSATLAGRILLLAAARPDQGLWWVDGRPWVINSWGNTGTVQRTSGDDYIMKLSWPQVRRTTLARGAAVRADSGAVRDAVVVGNLNDAMAADLARDRNAILVRTVARQAVKLAATKSAEAASKKKWGEVTGDLIGGFLNLAGAALERADTRGWLLLPASVSAVRLRLPAGTHALQAEVGGRVRPLGEVRVQGGAVQVVARRAWGDDALVLRSD